jgi:hypothetical protein
MWNYGCLAIPVENGGKKEDVGEHFSYLFSGIVLRKGEKMFLSNEIIRRLRNNTFPWLHDP